MMRKIFLWGKSRRKITTLRDPPGFHYDILLDLYPRSVGSRLNHRQGRGGFRLHTRSFPVFEFVNHMYLIKVRDPERV